MEGKNACTEKGHADCTPTALKNTIGDKWYKFDMLMMHVASLNKHDDSALVESHKLDMCRAFVDNVMDDNNIRTYLSRFTLKNVQLVMDSCHTAGKLSSKDLIDLRAHYLILLYMLPDHLKIQANKSLKQYCLRGTYRVYENYISLKKALIYFITKSINTIFHSISTVLIGTYKQS